ncbi:helix-turn-helix transcriptional regulator [Streptomyces venezuelae]|uniref:helix-turn-helix transcriptional regulator n=1 Tax=Streptomyces venezuelae TaxID=54571 RepID=UPI003446D7BB
MSTRPLLTQREAATACGVSRSTIRRRREAGDLPGAVLDDERGWLVPVEALLAAGFRLHAPSPPDSGDGEGQEQSAAPERTVPDGAAELRAELERLRHEHELQLAEERHARALAEAEVGHLHTRLEERAAHIADLQQALATLMPAPQRPAIPQPAPPVSPASEAAAPAAGQRQENEPRRRWLWSRSR